MWTLVNNVTIIYLVFSKIYLTIMENIIKNKVNKDINTVMLLPHNPLSSGAGDKKQHSSSTGVLEFD